MSRKLQADLLLTFCSLIWGLTFVVVKDALTVASVFVFLALRFGLAAIFLALCHGRKLRQMSLPNGAIASGLLMGSVLFSGFAFQAAGIALTTPSKAAFITGFSVILVPVFLAIGSALRMGGAQPRAQMNGWLWAGAACALAGLYYLTIPSPASALLPAVSAASGQRLGAVIGTAGFARGDTLVLCGAILFALHIIAMGHYIPLYTTGIAAPDVVSVLSLVQVATMAFLTLAAIPLFAAAGWQTPHAHWTPRLLVDVLITGILATALAFSAQVWAQQHTSSTHTAILFSLEPVFAALTSFLFLHERLGGRALAGGGLILVGILLAELRGPSPGPLPAAAESPVDAVRR